MAPHFATETSVPVEKSRAEIEATLTRYGATHFGYMTTPEGATVGFQVHGRLVRFHVPLPDRTARAFTHVWNRRYMPARQVPRAPADALRTWEQACRQRWRALNLVIRAKLEAVECGITTFETEFLAHIVIPSNNKTVGEWFAPQLEAVYATGRMPPLLPSGTGHDDG
jgi:hypothetical protein